MTVKELIDALQKCPQDAIVLDYYQTEIDSITDDEDGFVTLE